MKRRFASALLLPLLLAGCAAQPSVRTVAPPIPEPEPKDTQKAQAEIRLDLIRGMIAKGQYYAALAYVQDQRRVVGDSEELKLLEADARRNLQQTAAAEALYRQLLDSRYQGEARHGLGLLYAPADPVRAIAELQAAATLKPTDVEIRNDLGYALMQAGRYADAMPELSTAAELAPQQAKARNNLVILMLLMGNDAAADRLSRQAALSPETMKRLRQEAQAIQARQKPPAAG